MCARKGRVIMVLTEGGAAGGSSIVVALEGVYSFSAAQCTNSVGGRPANKLLTRQLPVLLQLLLLMTVSMPGLPLSVCLQQTATRHHCSPTHYIPQSHVPTCLRVGKTAAYSCFTLSNSSCEVGGCCCDSMMVLSRMCVGRIGPGSLRSC